MTEHFRSHTAKTVEPFVTDYFRDAPDEVSFGVALTRHPGSPLEGGLIMPKEDDLAVRLVQQSYRAEGIIDGSPDSLDKYRRLDNRSERFVVMERIAGRIANLFATTKLVHKVEGGDPLPIEKEFPWVFDAVDPAGCAEISQLTSRHPDDDIQGFGFLALLRASYGYAESVRMTCCNIGPSDDISRFTSGQMSPEEEARVIAALSRVVKPALEEQGQELDPPSYGQLGEVSTILCVTEKFVFERAESYGIDTHVLSEEPKLVPEFKGKPTPLYPVAFDLAKVREKHQEGSNQTYNLYLAGIERHYGLGWFGEAVIESIEGAPAS